MIIYFLNKAKNSLQKKDSIAGLKIKGKESSKQLETEIVKPAPIQPPPVPVKENDTNPTSLIFRQLGDLALKSLNNGEPVRDEIIVHILVEKIKTLSQDKGFIFDGFPTTFEQAKLLEKALSGYDEDHPVLPKPKRESILAPNPKPEPPKPKHQSAIDLIVYLDLSNEVVLKRSVGRYCNFINKLKFFSLTIL